MSSVEAPNPGRSSGLGSAAVRTALGWPRPRTVAVTAAVGIAAIVPLVVSNQYWVGTLTVALIWMTLNQGWSLVLGYTGIWHFGILAVYAAGGYSAALLSLHTSVPGLLAVVLGGLVASGLSLLLAVPSLRLRGIYVALLTFSFGEVIRLTVVSGELKWTGGSFGLSGFDGWGLSGMAPADRLRLLFWIALVVAIASTLLVFVLMRSPVGIALTALRDNPALAAARGVNPRRYQLLAFAASGFLAGVAGGLFAYNYGVISPTVMGLLPMTLLVTMIVIGGLGTVTGPLVGTLIIAVVSTELEQWPSVQPVVLGALLLLIILLMPRGLVPVVADAKARLDAWVEEDEWHLGEDDPKSTTESMRPRETTRESGTR